MSHDVVQKIMGGISKTHPYTKKEMNVLKKNICGIFNASDTHLSDQHIILYQMKQKSKKNNKSRRNNKSKKNNKSRRNTGGTIGSNEAIFYIFGVPNQHNKEAAMSYVEIKQKNKKDLFNIGSVENLISGIMSQEPVKTWYKRIKVEENVE